jgi:hypothetical protein
MSDEFIQFDYNDYPVELKLFRATVTKAKMVQYQVQNNRTSHRWLQYVNSTRVRLGFATWLIHSFYADRDITAALITTEMGVSRKAIDEMVNDWEAESWLYKEKGTGIDSTKYFLHPSPEILHINDEWFQWYEHTIYPLINDALTLYKASKVNISDLKHKAQFNTTSGTNLSGIEDNVASFILDGSRKRRSKGKT